MIASKLYRHLARDSLGVKNDVVVVVVSHIQRIGCQPEKVANNPKKLLDTVGNPTRGLLNRKKINLVAPPPPPRCSLGENKIKSRDASTCLGATQVLVCLASVQGVLRLVR